MVKKHSTSTELLFEDTLLDGTCATDTNFSVEQSHFDIVFCAIPAGSRARAKINTHDTINYIYSYTYGIIDIKDTPLIRAVKYKNECYFYTTYGAQKIYMGKAKKSIIKQRYTLYGWNGKEELKVCLKKNGYFKIKVIYNKNDAFEFEKRHFYNSAAENFFLNYRNNFVTPSEINFQVVNSKEPGFVTMGLLKLENGLFILDHTYPWSGFYAFAVSMIAIMHNSSYQY